MSRVLQLARGPVERKEPQNLGNSFEAIVTSVADGVAYISIRDTLGNTPATVVNGLQFILCDSGQWYEREWPEALNRKPKKK